MNFKDKIRKILVSLPFAITKNIEVDQLTNKVIKKVLRPNSNCIDVGCHKGEIMDVMLQYSENGVHFGFEPIPHLFQNLESKYQGKVKLFNCALGNEEKRSSFNLVTSNPAYSGLIKRKYDKKESDTSIEVDVRRLDDVISLDTKIDLIKIDTEGGEYDVLKGGYRLIQKWKPLIIFEHGLGASEYYGTKPEMVYDFFNDLDMEIFTLKDFITNKSKLSREEFSKQFYNKINYIFIAK